MSVGPAVLRQQPSAVAGRPVVNRTPDPAACIVRLVRSNARVRHPERKIDNASSSDKGP
jgi:hypothetical protein